MKIIGYSRNDFMSKEGRSITGCRIYLATEVDAGKGEGVMVKDMYLSDAKMAGLKINLHDLMGAKLRFTITSSVSLKALFCSIKSFPGT